MEYWRGEFLHGATKFKAPILLHFRGSTTPVFPHRHFSPLNRKSMTAAYITPLPLPLLFLSRVCQDKAVRFCIAKRDSFAEIKARWWQRRKERRATPPILEYFSRLITGAEGGAFHPRDGPTKS